MTWLTLSLVFFALGIGIWLGDRLSQHETHQLQRRILDALDAHRPAKTDNLATGYYRAIDAMAAALDDLAEDPR